MNSKVVRLGMDYVFTVDFGSNEVFYNGKCINFANVVRYVISNMSNDKEAVLLEGKYEGEVFLYMMKDVLGLEYGECETGEGYLEVPAGLDVDDLNNALSFEGVMEYFRSKEAGYFSGYLAHDYSLMNYQINGRIEEEEVEELRKSCSGKREQVAVEKKEERGKETEEIDERVKEYHDKYPLEDEYPPHDRNRYPSFY